MIRLRRILLVARRDFTQRARSRPFLVSMGVVFVVILGVGPLLALQFREPRPYRVGVEGTVPPNLQSAIAARATLFDRTVEMSTYPSTASGEEAVRTRKIDVLVEDGQRLVWRETENSQLATIVVGALDDLSRAQTITQLGLTSEEAARLLSPPAPASAILEPPDPERVPRIVGANVGTIVLYMAILLFGQFVLLGVLEEKSSRVVEVVLSRVRPAELLAGKVLGIGLLGILQIVAVGVAGMLLVTRLDIPGVALPSLGLRIILSVFLWFLLGFAFYAVVYAALGSTISRQEDTQGVAMIPALLLVPGYFIALFGLENPNGLLPAITSLIPPFAPVVMPMRLALGGVPLWQTGLSVLLLVASTYGLVRLAGRIYEGALLHLGAKVRLRDAWRSTR